MKRFLVVVTLFFSLGCCGIAQAVEYGGAFQADLRGGYSQLLGNPGIGLGLGDILVLPIAKLNANQIAMATLYASFSGQQKAIEEETFFVERGLFYFKPTLKQLLPDNWALKMSLLAQRSANLESFQENWLSDVYDYDEFGISQELDQEKGYGWGPFGILLEGVHRDYPNYHQGNQQLDGKNYYVKDYYGLRIGLHLDPAGPAWWQMQLNYQILLRYYTDNYIQTFNGTYDFGNLVRDQYHLFRWENKFPISAYWLAGLDWSEAYNQSNQAFFDQTVSPNLYLPNYFSYVSTAFKPWLRWFWQGDPNGHSLALSYQVLFLNYLGQPARNPDGSYTQGMQADVQHTLQLDGRYVFGPHWAALAGLSTQISNSNQQYELVVKSNYTIFNADAGVEFRF